MSLVSDAELANLRSLAAQVMTDTCTLKTPTESADGIGQGVQSWGNPVTGVACRLVFRTAGERVAGERVTGVGAWELWLPYDQAISREMRVYIGDRTFDVVGVNEDQTMRTHIVADLVEVT